MAKCKLCLEDRPRVEGHILSDFLYDELFDPVHHRFHQLHTHPITRNLTRPTGFYEKMMCDDCDNRIIGGYETYASQLFKGGVEFVLQSLADRILLKELDYQKFKLFLVSLLWRCAITTRPEFADVSIPPAHCERMRQMLLNGDPGKPHEYGCVVMIPEMYQELRHAILTPYARRVSGHHLYNLLAGGFWWLFVVSNHSDQFEQAHLFLSQDGRLNIMRERSSTKYLTQVAHDLVKNPTFPKVPSD
jgi:hypothetical protein